MSVGSSERRTRASCCCLFRGPHRGVLELQGPALWGPERRGLGSEERWLEQVLERRGPEWRQRRLPLGRPQRRGQQRLRSISLWEAWRQAQPVRWAPCCRRAVLQRQRPAAAPAHSWCQPQRNQWCRKQGSHTLLMPSASAMVMVVAVGVVVLVVAHRRRPACPRRPHPAPYRRPRRVLPLRPRWAVSPAAALLGAVQVLQLGIMAPQEQLAPVLRGAPCCGCGGAAAGAGTSYTQQPGEWCIRQGIKGRPRVRRGMGVQGGYMVR